MCIRTGSGCVCVCVGRGVAGVSTLPKPHPDSMPLAQSIPLFSNYTLKLTIQCCVSTKMADTRSGMGQGWEWANKGHLATSTTPNKIFWIQFCVCLCRETFHMQCFSAHVHVSGRCDGSTKSDDPYPLG